jgi:CubicO group peptidase (beta-lactamase class C family)
LFLLFSGLSHAASDEILLGKGQGYPVCPFPAVGALVDPHCLVGLLSNYDRQIPARKVAKAAAPRALKRVAQEPQIAYRLAGQPRTLAEFLDESRNTGLLVLQGDTILVERYQYGRKPEDRFQSFSMAKTVVAMLIGIALSEGKIASIDDRAEKYVPALKGQPYGETSLRHLLTMSSGVHFEERYDGRDDVTRLTRRTIYQQGPGGADTVAEFTQRERPAGTKFSYSSAETQVLGLVLRAAVGRPLADYLSEKIWQPMGAEANATWLLDKGGYETGYCCINATLRDYARFGMLLARYGELDGKQVIPREWVKAATTPEAPHLRVGTATANNGYGYQTWITSRAEPPHLPRFAALGIHGQAIYIDPVTKLVVVHTAAWADPTDRAERGAQFKLLEAITKLESQ